MVEDGRPLFGIWHTSQTGGARQPKTRARKKRPSHRKLMRNAKEPNLTSPTKTRCTTTTNSISKQLLINHRPLKLTRINMSTHYTTKTYHQNTRLLNLHRETTQPLRGKRTPPSELWLTFVEWKETTSVGLRPRSGGRLLHVTNNATFYATVV